MKVFARDVQPYLHKAARTFSAVALFGPRRAGKTFLLRHAFPQASYHLLEDPDLLERVRSDPRGWLDEIRLPAIIDEIQNAPELFGYIRARIDEKPSKKGQWILTGSHQFSLAAGISESMAGRAAIFELLPLSTHELRSWNLMRGGFPEVVLRPKSASLWFSSYIQTYLEKDVRAITAIKDLSTFRRFLSLLASRHGQILNRSDIAAPLGVSVPTISQWISILETTGEILVVPPYFENFGKRLVKSPKIYWMDSGLVCHLLGIESQSQLEKSPFIGAVFEGFIASEIIKKQINQGKRKELYYFRDEQGLEIDFLVPSSNGKLKMIETKWSKTVRPAMASPLLKLSKNAPEKTQMILVHRGSENAISSTALAPGVQAMSVEAFLLS